MLDAAKIVAALVPNLGDVLDYLEVIGAGQPLTEQPLPFLAVPTTAGTGSEVTMNGVVTSTEHGVKVSMRSPSMLATVALVDPELTLGCPPAVTASSGLDALTQCLEPFVSPFANPLTDGFCAEGCAAPAAACGAPTATATTWTPAPIWRCARCSAGCRWRTRSWAPCTAWPESSAD